MFDDKPHDITASKISPNKETLDILKGFIITSQKRCSISLTNITYNEERVESFTTITEKTQLLVSADRNITKATDRLTELKLCLDKLITGIKPNTLQLNVSGELKAGIGGGTPENVVDKSCCQVLYGFSADISECCRPGFVKEGEEGDRVCGKNT